MVVELPLRVGGNIPQIPSRRDGLRDVHKTETKETVVDLVSDTAQTFKVEAIIDLDRENKMDKYRFNSNSEGCSLWIYTLLKKLVSIGYLPEHAPDKTCT